MTSGDSVAPAGWYPDPDGTPRRRYWDGSRWTEYTDDTYRSPEDPWAGMSSWPATQPGWGGYGTPVTPRGLPDVGDFLQQCFVAAGRACLALLPYLLVFAATLAVLGIAVAGTSEIDEWVSEVVEISQDTAIDEDTDLPDFPPVGGAEVGLVVVIVVLGVVGSLVLPIAFMRPAADAVRGGEVHLDEGGALARAVGRVLLVALVLFVAYAVLMVALVLFAVATGGFGMILFLPLIPLGFWLFVRWQLVPALIVLDGMTFDALGRSFALTRNRFWPVFGRVLLFGLIVGVATQVVAVPLQLLFAVDAGVALVLIVAASLVVQLISQMVSMAPAVVLRQRLLELEQTGELG